MPRHIALILLVLVPLVARDAAASDPPWGLDGLALATGPSKQRAPRCWPDGQGGLLVVWADHREGWLHDILLQRLTREGRPALGWPDSGVRRTGVWGFDYSAYLDWDAGAAAPAGDGGIFLAWRDRRFVPPGSQEWLGDLFLVRYDASGAVAAGWPADGIPLSVEQWYETEPVLLPDGAGGVFVAWTGWGYSAEVRVDHVQADGTRPRGWAEDGLRAIRAVLPYQMDIPVMVRDGAGGIYMGWRASTADRAFGLNHILADGRPDPDWPDDGIALGEGHCQDLRLAPGPGGDVYAVWTEVSPIGPTFSPWPIRALRLGPQGTVRPGWPNQGMIATRSSMGSQSVTAIPDEAGGLFLVWPNYVGPGVDVRVQRLDPWGRFYFTDSAVPMCQMERNIYEIQAIPDGAGGVAAAWSITVPVTDYDIYARLISGAGELSHASTPRGNEVILGSRSQMGAKLASDGGGGVYLVWTETDMGSAESTGDIYAQWLPASTLPLPPQPPSLSLSLAHPNPMAGTTTVQLELPRAGAVEAAVFDVRGARVRVLAREVMPAGAVPLVWDGRDERGRSAASGIYFIEVRAGSERLTRRVALVP